MLLSYVVDSTAAPACVIVPITTWAVFAGGLLEINGWAPEGEGLIYFIKTIEPLSKLSEKLIY